jgi:hypothetical protein
MPIRPENAKRYPSNWKTEVVPRIRARSGNRCECTGQCGVTHNSPFDLSDALDRCGIANGDVSYMTPDGKWHGCNFYDEGEEMERRDGKVYRAVKIVLTVMHLNHQPEDCDDANLLHACQGCHNRYDAPMRTAGKKARAMAARASGDLFQCEETS